jgi:uncharacterized protein (TIGR03663 family)
VRGHTANKDAPVKRFLIFSLVALALGMLLRLPFLEARPMHTDEAVHAVKLSRILDGAPFIYDPYDYHGPTLYYLTWLCHGGPLASSTDLTDASLRLVTVASGIATILLALAFSPFLGRTAALVAALFFAVSPPFVYYSRYFIMEMILVDLSLLSLLLIFWWLRKGGPGGRSLAAPIFLGLILGLMHATKETFVLNTASLCLALAACLYVSRKETPLPSPATLTKVSLWVAVPALLVSAALVSHFFQRPSAIWDSYTTYLQYLDRSGGAGHQKPFSYYFSLLFWTPSPLPLFRWQTLDLAPRWPYGELALVAFALLALPVALRRTSPSHLPALFLTLYSSSLFLVYSILSYKTPWSILPAHAGLILLAAVGFAALWHRATHPIARALLALVLVASVSYSALQSRRAIDPRWSHEPSRAPYAYSHTSVSAETLAARLRDLASFGLPPETPARAILIANEDAGWPFPWLLRDLSAIAYLPAPPSLDDYARFQAPIVALQASWLSRDKAPPPPGLQPVDFYGLRDGVLIQLYVEPCLWRNYLDSRP